MKRTEAWRPRQIAIIGCGTIGIGWAAYFLAHGLRVTAYDPSSGARQGFAANVAEALEAMQAPSAVPEVADTQEAAVKEADLIVENAPEDIPLKRRLLTDLQNAAPTQAIIASSTSSLRHSDIACDAPTAERIVIAHPFNPPHLVPLVELYGPRLEIVERLRGFYLAIGKQPIVMRREMTGHVANRLTAALWREALYLLQEDVASVEDIDTAVTAGPGLRWAILGPFLTYHLGGGPGGIRHYLDHLGSSQQRRWATLGTPEMGEALAERIVAGVDDEMGERSLAQLAAHRDRKLQALLTQLSETNDREEAACPN